VAVIRDMKAAAQEEVPLEKVLEYLRNGQ